MKIAVFGLGYVGIVSAACFAERGHEVVGVDLSEDKVALVNDGRTTVHEPGIGELVRRNHAAGRLNATTSASKALEGADIAVVCVGTPSRRNGSLSTEFLKKVSSEIGAVISKDRRLVVVYRSTMLPGTCEGTLIPELEGASGLTVGDDFGVAVNPEFLREGTSVEDFANPPKTVVGQSDDETGDVVISLYEGLPGPVFRIPISAAEMTKYVDNSFHALKVTFGNEIGALCKASGCDVDQVMDIFLSDTKLNISPAYLRPGFAFGGSCLPKDVRAITYHSKALDVATPILDNVLPSNERHLQRAFDLVMESGLRRVGLFGLSFKSGTDDLRESPMVALAERLLGRGFELAIYDGQVLASRLMGANREYVDARIPHLSDLMFEDPGEVLRHAQICVVGVASPEITETIASANGETIIDLVRLPNADAIGEEKNYVGLCW